MRRRCASALTLVLAATALLAFAAVAPAAGSPRHVTASHHHRAAHHRKRQHHRRHAGRPVAAHSTNAATAGTTTMPATPTSMGSAEPVSRSAASASPALAPAPPTCEEEKLPMGCPIQTITSSGGIQVGNDSYPAAGNWVRLLVLDPTHLTPVECGGKTCDLSFNADQTAALLQSLGEIPAPSDDLVILSGQGIPQHFSAAQTSALKSAFEKLGGTLEPDGAARGGAEALHSGAWSLLGRVGATGGFAEQNYEAIQAGIPEFLEESTGERGSLNGYLQIVNIPTVYEYVSPEFVKVDTSGEGSNATENFIEVGEQTYRSQKIQAGQQAFQLVFIPNEPGASAREVINATIVTRNADGQVNPAGVHELASSLEFLRHSEIPGQQIGIVQSFGRTSNSGQKEISDSPDWVADELPFAGLTVNEEDTRFGFYNWCGTGEDGSGRMDGHDCEGFPNEPTSLGKAPTVTQVVGELAGMRARNEVADLGLEGQPEALSLISPAHPYSESDAVVAVGEAGERTVGVLRRSRQSQWTVAGASPGLTDTSGKTLFDPASMWEVIFGTRHEEWPDSGPPGSSFAEASRYIAGKLFPGEGLTDIRQAYSSAPTWIVGAADKVMGIKYPTAQRPHFSRADFEALKAELIDVEFPDLENIDTMTQDYQAVFGKQELTGLVNFRDINQELISKALNDDEAFKKEIATVNEGPSVGSATYFAADLIGLLGPEADFLTGPMDFMAGSYDFFSELYGSSDSTGSATQPFGEPQQLRDEAAKLALDMAERYEALSGTFGHFEVLFDTDWARLRKASQLATKRWSLAPVSGENPQLGLLQQSLATAGQAGLYEALVPLAYDQWVVSPWWTKNEEEQNHAFDPATYTCLHEPGNFEHPVQPFDGFPGAGMGQIRWEAEAGQPFRNHFTTRVLVSKSDPLTLESVSEKLGLKSAEYPGVKNVGAAPEKVLTEKLFDPPTKASKPSFPDGLDLSKVGFFGLPTWTMPRLQCGMPLAYAIEEE
ncbi:MAG TPA: hypothetical protein VGH14_12820 [Solirubrobacterales bacterium]